MKNWLYSPVNVYYHALHRLEQRPTRKNARAAVAALIAARVLG